MVHASAVVDLRDDRAVVFLGNSGSGKSSVALQLVERGGYAFLSNDRVLMRADAEGVDVVGLPKQPRVNPGTLLASKSLSRLVSTVRRDAYSQMTPDELWQLEEKTDVDVGQVFESGWRLRARLGRIYSLRWQRGGTGLIELPLTSEEALADLRITSKDFGPFDLRLSERDPLPQLTKIAQSSGFARVLGALDPPRLARSVATRA
jgi:HprK-related kinase B